MDVFDFFVTKKPWEIYLFFVVFRKIKSNKYLYFDCYNQKTRLAVKDFDRNLEDIVRYLKDSGRNLTKSRAFLSKS